MMVFWGLDASFAYIIVALFLTGMGMGFHGAASSTALMQTVLPKDINIAMAVYMMFVSLTHTVSVILSTSLSVFWSKGYLFRKSVEAGLVLSPHQHQELAHLATKIEPTMAHLKDFLPEQVPQLLTWLKEACVYGFSFNMILATLCSLMAVAIILWGFGFRIRKALLSPTHTANPI